MSTNGALGFRINKEDKIMYNHDDSYPFGLGNDVIDFIRSYKLEDIKNVAAGIEMIDGQSSPTPKQIKLCQPWLVSSVSKNDNPDWYSLLRGAQGNLGAYMNGLPYMKDSQTFLHNSLYCEYAYIINLDKNQLEFYYGFNKKNRKKKGRYANKHREGDKSPEYWGVVLLMAINLEDIVETSDSTISNMLQTMNKKAEKFQARQEVKLKKEKLEKKLVTM